MSPIGSGRKPAASGLESVRHRAAVEGLSGHAASLVVGSWREGTQGAYNSAWNKWCRWCGGHQIDPFQATVANIINFLSELQEQGYEYNTLNVHRSAISAYHPPIGGVKVGQLPLVTRMMGGSFNIKPPQPKYHPLKCVQWPVLLGGALGRMFCGSSNFLLTFDSWPGF